MHPILSSGGRLAVYLLAWVPLTAMLMFLTVVTGGLSWIDGAALIVPVLAFYSFVCLSPWYLCTILPLSSSRQRILLNQGGAAATAGLLLILAARACSWCWKRVLPTIDKRIDTLLPMLFGMGVILYMLAVALHYVLLSVEASREAEKREQEAQVFARDAELKALKAQINPHFLFNSLNSISALTTVDGSKAREMCIRLSDFLRKTLAFGDKETIPLREEVAMAQTYLSVEQIRFGSRLTIDFALDEICAACEVPPLVLQPLVENAVKHGISGLVEGGTIRLRANCNQRFVRITVENSYDTEYSAPRRSGVGLANIRGRLKARYDNTARLDTSADNGLYRAELLLPCHALAASAR
ncbi:MAG TPA: histidine kinase [Bryobacteraceae bacterium]|nr:histidine kinase [Bryobacteraceae bacterium]